MGSSLNEGPLSGPQQSAAPVNQKEPKRGPQIENYPCRLRFRVEDISLASLYIGPDFRL